MIYTLHRGGPKPAIIIASVFILLGNWIRYAATKSGPHGNYGGVMFGQILTGLAQPFVLSAPTRYSDLWFTNRGRVAATAIMSLANPFGGALAQLIDPFWASTDSGAAKDIPNMVLYISIIVRISYRSQHRPLTPTVFYRIYTLIFYPSTPTNSLFCIWPHAEGAFNGLPQSALHHARVLHDHDPLHLLRRSLQ